MNDLFHLFDGFDTWILNDYFIQACEDGELDKVKYLLTSPKLTKNVSCSYRSEQALRNACKHGHLDIVQYLLTSPDLNKHANLHHDNDTPFVLACFSGNLNLIKYLLTSEELKSHPDIHANYMGSPDYALTLACQKGYLEVVKYLLTSPDLNDHANIHADRDRPILNAYQKNNLDIVRFLIFDMNIKKTEDIKRYMENEPMEEVKNWFKLRELNDELIQEISTTHCILKNSKTKL